MAARPWLSQAPIRCLIVRSITNAVTSARNCPTGPSARRGSWGTWCRSSEFEPGISSASLVVTGPTSRCQAEVWIVQRGTHQNREDAGIVIGTPQVATVCLGRPADSSAVPRGPSSAATAATSPAELVEWCACGPVGRHRRSACLTGLTKSPPAAQEAVMRSDCP